MLDMQADQNDGRSVKKAGNRAGTAGHAQGVELFAGGRFDQAMQFFEVQSGVPQKLGEIERHQQLQGLGNRLADWQLGSHDRPVKGRSDLNPHRSTVWPPPRPRPRSSRRWRSAHRSGTR